MGHCWENREERKKGRGRVRFGRGVGQGDVFLSVLPPSYFRLYSESRRFSWNTFHLRIPCPDAFRGCTVVACMAVCGVAVHRENGAGRPTFLATGGCWPKLKIPGTDCEKGGGERKTSYLVVPSSYFWIFTACGRGVRDKRNVTNVG